MSWLSFHTIFFFFQENYSNANQKKKYVTDFFNGQVLCCMSNVNNGENTTIVQSTFINFLRFKNIQWNKGENWMQQQTFELLNKEKSIWAEFALVLYYECILDADLVCFYWTMILFLWHLRS